MRNPDPQMSSGIIGFNSLIHNTFIYKFEFSEKTLHYYNIVFFGFIMVLITCYLIYQQNNLILSGISHEKNND